jgi:succinoglycan biosynthesis transport protein ExoP
MAEQEVHLRDYLAIIRKHDFIVIVSFLLVFGSALIVSLYMSRIYEAVAVIEVQSATTPSGLSSLMQNVMSRGVDQVSMETICKRFTSRSLLAEVARNLKKRMPEGIEGGLVQPEALAPKIRAKIAPDTRVIEVSVRMRRDEGGSQHAARVTNELVSVMQTRRSAKSDAKTERRQDFIDSKIKAVEYQIDDLDHGIRQFLRDSGDALVWSARADYVLTRLSSSIELKENSETLLAAQQRKLDELKVRLNEEPEWTEYSKTFSRDTLWDRYRTDLAELKKEHAAVRAEFGERSPNVKSLEAQISEIRDGMKNMAQEVMSAKTESRSPTYQMLLNQVIDTELNLIAYEAQLEIAENMVSKLNDEKEQIFSEMPESKFQLDKMLREVDYRMDTYKILQEKKLEAEIWASENSDDNSGRVRGGIEIVDMAQPGSRPVSPRVKFIGAIAGLVGLAVGLAMAFLAEYFENTYQSPEEVKEDLDVPILGMIPEATGKGRRREEEREGRFLLPVLESPMSVEAESFRTLVTNIEFSSPETPHEALLITSSGAGEGKSFAAANLAVAMAQTGEQVILMDCDMRRGIQHRIFGVGMDAGKLVQVPGLTNLLVGNAPLELVLQDTDIPNLKLIGCGTAAPNPMELLKSQRMGKILSELREACDVLLCDSPPVLPVGYALILASKLDGVLLIADLNRMPREVIRQAREQLSKLDVPLLGLVCNRVGAVKYDSYYHRSDAREPTAVSI